MIVEIFFSSLFLLCLRFQAISAKDYSIKLGMEAARQRRDSNGRMSAVSHIAANCMSYSRPPANKIGKLLIEILKNLEGDHSSLIQNLVDSLNRSRLFVGPAVNDEDMFNSLVKNTYYVAHGEPLATFPRIMGIVWLLIADQSVNRKLGWCPLNKITNYISSTSPVDIAGKFAKQKYILSRARFVMEEFIADNAALHEYLRRDHSMNRKSNRIRPRTRKLVEVELDTESIESHNQHIEEFVENNSYKVLSPAQDADNTLYGNYPLMKSKANSLRVLFYLNLFISLLNIIFIL